MGPLLQKKILHLKEKPIRYENNNYTFVYLLAGDAEGDILLQCQRWTNIISSSENKIYYQHIRCPWKRKRLKVINECNHWTLRESFNKPLCKLSKENLIRSDNELTDFGMN